MNDASVRILLVDDDESMRMICLRFLARCMDGSLVVEEAKSGEDAIEMLRDRAFDCILSDFRMGAVTGIDVLAFAKKERPKAIRILFTGYAAPAIHSDAIARARVHEFLEKPMTKEELESLLTEHMIERYLKPLARKKAQEIGVRP